jgi:hypothetical protein
VEQECVTSKRARVCDEQECGKGQGVCVEQESVTSKRVSRARESVKSKRVSEARERVKLLFQSISPDQRFSLGFRSSFP